MRHEVLRDGILLDLTPTEFRSRFSRAMPARCSGLSRMQLLDKVQGEDFEGYERTIDAHVKNLRQKVEYDPQRPRHIQTTASSPSSDGGMMAGMMSMMRDARPQSMMNVPGSLENRFLATFDNRCCLFAVANRAY